MSWKRIAQAASIAVGAGMLWAGPAWAAGTVVTYTGSPVQGAAIVVTDSPGRVLTLDVWEHAFRGRSSCGQDLVCIADRSGPIEESSPHCAQVTATLVRCSAKGLRRIEVRTGDGADRAVLGGWDTGIEAEFMLGPGADIARVGAGLGSIGAGIGIGAIVAAGRGDDVVRLRGPGKVIGQRGNDILRGFAGPQRLFGGDGQDWFSCGKGKDLAKGGPGADHYGRGCETIKGFFNVDDGVGSP